MTAKKADNKRDQHEDTGVDTEAVETQELDAQEEDISTPESDASKDSAKDSVEVTPANDDDLFEEYANDYEKHKDREMTLTEYLNLCKENPLTYANAAERLLDAIGEPEYIDTSNDPGALGKIHGGATIAHYPAFKEFYGMDGEDETIQKIISHLKGAAEGSEYSKQVMFLLGPVGGGKSSLGDELKKLMEKRPIYTLKCINEDDPEYGELSPLNEIPLGIFDTEKSKDTISNKFDIPQRYMKSIISPWATKRLENAGGNPNKAFAIVERYPSRSRNIAIGEIDPQEENTQDVSAFTGKGNINELGEGLDENDPDSYLFSGGFAIGNQGIIEMDEMLKMPLKVLNPLLKALQSKTYQASNVSIGPIPVDGLFLGQTNESEFQKFFGNKSNEAMIDRINTIHVPYSMRIDEEAKIYKKQLAETGYSDKPIAPKTIDLLAEFCVMTRLLDVEGNDKYPHKIRAQVMNGDSPTDPREDVPTIGELRKNLIDQDKSTEEGMSGISPRFAFKTLTEAFNAKANEGEVGIDPLLLFETLEKRIIEDKSITPEQTQKYIGFIRDDLMPEYSDFLEREISEAFSNSSDSMCQNMFDRYIKMAIAWVDEEPLNDKSVTGGVLSLDDLNTKMAEIERPAKIVEPKDFRDKVSRYVLRQERETGEKVRWDSFEKMATVIRANLVRKMKDVMPYIQFDGPEPEGEDKEKFDTFLKNMDERGYTMPMIKRAVGHVQKMKPS